MEMESFESIFEFILPRSPLVLFALLCAPSSGFSISVKSTESHLYLSAVLCVSFLFCFDESTNGASPKIEKALFNVIKHSSMVRDSP